MILSPSGWQDARPPEAMTTVLPLHSWTEPTVMPLPPCLSLPALHTQWADITEHTRVSPIAQCRDIRAQQGIAPCTLSVQITVLSMHARACSEFAHALRFCCRALFVSVCHLAHAVLQSSEPCNSGQTAGHGS